MYELLPPGPQRTPTQIVREGRHLWWSNLPGLLLIGVIFTGPFMIAGVALTVGLGESVVEVDGRIDVLFASNDLRDLHRMLSGVLAIASVLSGLIAWGAMVAYVWRRRLAEEFEWSAAVRLAMERVGPLLLVAMIEFLVVVLVAIVLIALFSVSLPGLIAAMGIGAFLFIRVWLAQVVMMVEDESGTDALRRSAGLVSGRIGPVLGVLGLTVVRLVIIGLGVTLATLFLTQAIEAIGSPMVTLAWIATGQLAVSALLSPLVVSIAVPLYIDLRRRRQ